MKLGSEVLHLRVERLSGCIGRELNKVVKDFIFL